MNVVCWCILACFHAIIVGFGQSPYINFKPRGWPIWAISVCTKDISCYEIFPIMDFKKNMRISGMLKIDQHLWYPSWNLASSQAVAWTWLLTSWPESFNHFRCRQRKHHPSKRLDIRLEDTVSKLIQTEKMNQAAKIQSNPRDRDKHLLAMLNINFRRISLFTLVN